MTTTGETRKSRTPVYWVWLSMRNRCYRPSVDSFKYYGAKGIRVCDRWHSFDNFIADMGPRPNGATLERKDSTKDYGPENCVWATMKQQQNNRTNNRRITVRGQTLTLQQWAERTGKLPDTIAARIKNGATEEDAIFQPVRQMKPRKK